MYNSNTPNQSELPSTAKLVKSTILAGVGAIAILFTVVMPAEYGIDPTGFGRLTGLQTMGQIKMSLAEEAAAEELAKQQAFGKTDIAETKTVSPAVQVKAAVAPIVEEPTAGIRQDSMTVTLEPNEGREIKVDLKKGQAVKYVWESSAGKANYDVHGDSKALDIDYHGYGKGASTREEGTIEAAFDGNHGWFWRNRTNAPLTVTLQTEGPYTTVKPVK